MATTKATPLAGADVTLLAHLRKHDHWTFLVAVLLVGINVHRGDHRISALALAFLLTAFGYDLYEVAVGREDEPPAATR